MRKKIAGRIPINRLSPRFPSRSISSVPLGDAIRRRVGRGVYHLPPDEEGSGETSGKSRTERRTGMGTVSRNLTMIFIG